MNIFFLLFIGFLLLSCSNRGFDRDARQIIVRNEIRKQMPPGSAFDILSFHEDTIDFYKDSVFQHPIIYMTEVNFINFPGHDGKHTVRTLFTQDGKSILGTEILDATH